MRKIVPNISLALMLTPAIFLLAFWILALSGSGLLASIGLSEMILWALLLSFGVAYSITLFVNEVMKQHNI